MSFLKGAFAFVTSPTHTRTITLFFAIAVLAAVPLTVLVAQKQQELRQRADTNYCSMTLQACPTANLTEGVDCTSLGTQTCRKGNEIWQCK